MSQKDNFGSGFLLGTIVGGVLGGLLGVTLAQRLADESENPDTNGNSPKRRWRPERLGRPGRISSGRGETVGNASRSASEATAEARIEVARRSLENKIAQLNSAIDEVRHQLEDTEPASTPSPDRSPTDA